MRRNYLIASILLMMFSFVPLSGQNISEALQFSNFGIGGTARTTALSGAFTALGADFGSLSLNPAGIATYRKGEVTFSLGLPLNSSESQYLGSTKEGSKNKLVINQGGIVWNNESSERGKLKGWRSSGFAVGFNRLADFNQITKYEGYNNDHSFTSFMAEAGNGTSFDALVSGEDLAFNADYYTWLGYYTYLVDPDTTDITGSSWLGVAENGGVQQRGIIETTGGVNAVELTYGANYKDKLYIGVGLGLPFLKYNRENLIIEEDVNSMNPLFTDFAFREELKVEGTGLNIKLGVIYWANDWLRFGGSFHSPTWYSLEETFETDVNANILGPSGDENIFLRSKKINSFEYNLATPLEGHLGAAAFIKKKGFVSLDYGIKNYGGAKYGFDGFNDFQEELNDLLLDSYQATHTINLGGEFAVNPQFMLRAGIGYQSDPYETDAVDGSRVSFSGGFGFRPGKFFVDVAYRHTKYDESFYPYFLESRNNNLVNTEHVQGTGVLTAGVKF